LPRLREQGYTGGYSILKAFVHHVPPGPHAGFPHAPVRSGRVRPSGLGTGWERFRRCALRTQPKPQTKRLGRP
jgi:hypothetical protein